MRIGVDLAKQVFELHGVDERDQSVLRKRLSRSKMQAFFAQLAPRVVAMEACGSAHHWARTLRALGHEVRLIDARLVAPCRKGGQERRQ